MRRKLYGQGVPRACSHCFFGVPAQRGGQILWIKKGIVAPDFKCRKYKYDPLRRIPRVQPEPEQYDPADFSLS